MKAKRLNLVLVLLVILSLAFNAILFSKTRELQNELDRSTSKIFPAITPP